MSTLLEGILDGVSLSNSLGDDDASVVVVGAAGLALCVGAWLLWLFVWQTLVALGCRGGVVNRLL